ncbi:MAG: hypothetical protein EBV10_10995, partial [Synechococcaceae bacterium WB6_1A_059]|nr:hypothetical protein [Synechococcaceae bacterium WB6_1A_059]
GDLNSRPSGYEPDELPGCSTPRHHQPLIINYHLTQLATHLKPLPSHGYQELLLQLLLSRRG